MSLLEDFIKDLNVLETARHQSKFERILSIDVVKGLAICLIVMGHTGEVWITQEWLYAYAMIFIWADVFGPSLFIFLSALSVIFSLKKKMGFVPEKALRNSILMRGVIIMGLGVIYNITGPRLPFPLNLWGWNILMFIGASQIFCYYAVKLTRGARVVVGMTIIFITNGVREFLYVNKDENPVVWVFHYILISPNPHLPFIPYISMAFFSTIFGEMFFEAMLLESREAYMDVFKRFMKYGLLLVFLGVVISPAFIDNIFIVGAGDLDTSEYLHMKLLPIMQNQDWIQIDGIPVFLIRGTASNMFYSLGMALLILGVFFFLIDIKHIDNYFVKMLIFYGRVSLSIFFMHYIGFMLFYRQLTAYFYFPVYFAYVGFWGILLYIWNMFFDGVGTFEWMMTSMTGKKKKK